MLCHWRYVLDNLFGEVSRCRAWAPRTSRSAGTSRASAYTATADDAAYATFELKGHGRAVIAQINSSWVTRVRRDDLVTFHVDGTHGSAVAGLHDCRTQAASTRPSPVWNPDVKQTHELLRPGRKCPTHQLYDNGFKTSGSLHPPRGRRRALPLDPAGRRQGRAAGRGALQSWKERRWVDVPAMTLSAPDERGSALTQQWRGLEPCTLP
jgi:hypothetical protein